MSRTYALSPRSLHQLVSQKGLSEDAARALLNGGRRSRPRAMGLLARINERAAQAQSFTVGGRRPVRGETDVETVAFMHETAPGAVIALREGRIEDAAEMVLEIEPTLVRLHRERAFPVRVERGGGEPAL